MAILRTKNNKIMLSLEHTLDKIEMLILYSLVEKNYSLGIFQLRKYTDFTAKLTEITFLNLRVIYKHKSKMIICSKFTHNLKKKIC